MLGRKLKWTLLFENRSDLEELLSAKNPTVHKNMFGEVLLVKNKEEYLAFKNQCPHQKKPLNDCKLSEGHIVCPWHQYHYSCETGRGHGLYLDQYPLKFENDAVYIGKEVWTLFG
ncbi:MAG: nitrite reductase/ring-hydroxylating ferredoxin subunit [Crocinitomicaceae bacterium]|jgi:nitrite reductase/ring-hydroxylating ferredoxin subunit